MHEVKQEIHGQDALQKHMSKHEDGIDTVILNNVPG